MRIDANESGTTAARIAKAFVNVLGWLLVALTAFIAAILDLAKRSK